MRIFKQLLAKWRHWRKLRRNKKWAKGIGMSNRAGKPFNPEAYRNQF